MHTLPSRAAGLLASLTAVVAVGGLAAACTSSGSAPEQAVAETRGPAGPVPPGLAKFYGQPLTWTDCSAYASSDAGRTLLDGDPASQCARLTVPLDYTKPQGTAITVGLIRIRASDQADRIGSLIMNPGGPGASGIEAAAGMLKNWRGTELARRFDLVGFDPRGIGASTPAVHCLTGEEQDRQRASDLDDDPSPGGVAAYEAQQKEFAAKCVQRTGDGKDFLANVGTVSVAKDLDVLRSVLGDKKLTYLGYSYGTRLGSIYAEQFPRNVRAMILDGAVDPTQNVVDETVDQGVGFQTAFDKFAQWCVKQKSGCALGNDPAQANTAFHDLVDPLLTAAVPVGDGRKLGFDDATTGVIQALYSEQFWPILNSGLKDLKQRNGRILMLLADNYEGRNANGTYSNEQDAFAAIRCVDDPPVTDPATLLEQEQRYKQAAPFLDDGRPAVAEEDACAYWPVPPTGRPHLPEVTGLAPTLVISTTNDPATPYQDGVNLAKALHGGLLSYQSTQHTAFLQGNSCVDRAGTDYLVNLTLPPAGKTCSSS